MGVPMAERLLAAGHELVVWNRTRARSDEFAAGANGSVSVSDTPAGLDAELCLPVVADDAALEGVALGDDGVLAGAREGAVLVDLSTVSAPASARVAEAADAAGVAFLRAPVSGNPGVVRAGNLTIMVSGPRPSFDRVEPVLRAIGPNLHHVGPGEEARIAKLALNLMVAGTAELMSEAIVLGESHGLEPAVLLEVMGGSAVGSPLVKYKTGPLLNGDYSATFTTAMMRKDAGLIRDAAGDAGVELPVAALLEDLLERTIAAGHGDEDFMAVLLRLREEGS
jgi:3-hydroxyisobutyrate dehydrogenase-like beta-hydroxyacid dehydrogenase